MFHEVGPNLEICNNVLQILRGVVSVLNDDVNERKWQTHGWTCVHADLDVRRASQRKTGQFFYFQYAYSSQALFSWFHICELNFAGALALGLAVRSWVHANISYDELVQVYQYG